MKLINYEGLKAKGIDYTRVHLRRRVAAGTFPAPIPMGENRISWDEDEIDTWLAQRAANRNTLLQLRQETAKVRTQKGEQKRSATRAAKRQTPAEA